MTENKPLISVIIPTYNRAKLVLRAIQSALNQTFQDLEVIVVDDGSTDNTREMVGEFVKLDDRVRFLQHTINKGVSAARNTAIMQARGEYIALLDSDCIWLPEKIENQLKAFREASEKVGIVSTGFIYDDGNEPRTQIREGISGEMYYKLIRGLYWPGEPSSLLIKAQCFEKVGLFDEKLPMGEDTDIYIRISKYYHFGTVAEPLLIERRIHQDRLTKNSMAMFEGRKRLLEKYRHEFPRVSLLKYHCSAYVSQIYFTQGNFRLSRRYYRQALLAQPIKSFNIFKLIIAFLPYPVYNLLKAIKSKYY